jgi:purine/pyrimidine-nucleoside phosphorylase
MSDSSQPAPLPTQFAGVTVVAKANLYFEGGVVSHTLLFPDGAKKTLGLIRPGSYHFNTDAPERMEIVAGACRVRLDQEKTTRDYTADTAFDVPGHSGFQIEVAEGVCEYICSFLK